MSRSEDVLQFRRPSVKFINLQQAAFMCADPESAKNTVKVGLNLVKNRLHSMTNVANKKWIDLSLESYKLECKKHIIQNSLLSL